MARLKDLRSVYMSDEIWDMCEKAAQACTPPTTRPQWIKNACTEQYKREIAKREKKANQ